ncbi:hypothetical protein, partial [uncultured Xanthomonas sp.]|uniref:hypothetical protein n=1 Tax=uncultured Xanthomonas sp. TaxID=152831 RepID=UPI0025F49023
MRIARALSFAVARHDTPRAIGIGIGARPWCTAVVHGSVALRAGFLQAAHAGDRRPGERDQLIAEQ